MRILVIGSCGKKKLNLSTKSLTCNDLATANDVGAWLKNPGDISTQVRDLYIGNQNRELVKGVDLLRRIEKTDVQLHVISAGFGLVEESTLLPPYDCSFSGMKVAHIRERAEWLKISSSFAATDLLLSAIRFHRLLM